MDSGKIVAIITGAISIILAVAYLVLVQVLDFRGEMVPAPTENLGMTTPLTAIGVGYNQSYTNLYIKNFHGCPGKG
ncbi:MULTISPECIES: hypothetical protein [unclassified Synechocystis]|uniref:hypothetical protein n=1 Tax=unclassified Synechocystis TaxID=2640012 RepID=UPI00056F2F36|nr:MULTISPECIES: hypothetical protein [unclassified Synechocystis]MCT0255108.1 hypothetical protein [Synechocystis sp. CS-94]